MDSDPVIDFKIMEAVSAKVNQEQEEALKAQEQKKWRQDTSELRQFA